MNTRTNLPIRTWLLIGAFMLIAVVVFGIWVATRTSEAMETLLNRTDQPDFVAVHYYEAMRQQDYAAAYADLDDNLMLNGQTLTQQRFVQLATQTDTRQGAVTAYNLLQTSDGYNVRLTRGSQSYTVHFQLQQIGRAWKITRIDGL